LVRRATHLLLIEPCEAEHANLVGDVLPVVAGAFPLQIGDQVRPHGDDAVGHELDLLEPERAQLGRGEDLGMSKNHISYKCKVNFYL